MLEQLIEEFELLPLQEDVKEHSRRVKNLALSIANKLMDSEGGCYINIRNLEVAALYHDVGKMYIPENILNKPGKHTVEEFEVMKTHAKIKRSFSSCVAVRGSAALGGHGRRSVTGTCRRGATGSTAFGSPGPSSTWVLGFFTLVFFNAFRKFNESDYIFASSYYATGINVGIRQKFREKWSATLVASYERDDYNGVNREDDYFSIGPAVRYEPRKWLTFDLAYYWNRRDSNLTFYDYTSNEIFLRATFSI